MLVTIKEKELLIMKLLVLTNGKFETKEITNELEDLQKIVGGYIEVPFLTEIFTKSGIDVIINEEGKFIEGLRPEIAIVDKNTNRILDVVMGNCIFASHDEEGETIPLTEEQYKVVMRELHMCALLAYKDENVVVRVLSI
jgi:hypothetical protein